jgi:hypothetical protein
VVPNTIKTILSVSVSELSVPGNQVWMHVYVRKATLIMKSTKLDLHLQKILTASPISCPTVWSDSTSTRTTSVKENQAALISLTVMVKVVSITKTSRAVSVRKESKRVTQLNSVIHSASKIHSKLTMFHLLVRIDSLVTFYCS